MVQQEELLSNIVVDLYFVPQGMKFLAQDNHAPTGRNTKAQGASLGKQSYITAALKGRNILAHFLLFTLFPFSSITADERVVTILENYCLDCHDDDTRKGKLSLESILKFGDATPETWAKTREQVELRHMPPKKKKQLTDDERKFLTDWIAQNLRDRGHHVIHFLELPNYGNYVDHATLFYKKPHPAPATKVRIWRKRPEAYSHKVSSGIQPFSMVPGQQISDFSTLYSVDESATEIILRNSRQIIESRTQVELKNGKLVGKAGTRPQSTYFPILHPEQSPSEEAFNKVLSWQFYQFIGRQPTEEELKNVRGLYDNVEKNFNRLEAARAVLTVPMLMPESLYRLELGSGELDEWGRRRLSRDEIVLALSHTLSDGRTPQGIYRFGKGPLDTQEAVEKMVLEILSDKKPNKWVLKFFDEYFDYRKAREVFKEVPSNFTFAATNLVRDTEMLIHHIVQQDKDVLKTLLTTTQTFINDRSVPPHQQKIYNLPQDWKYQSGLVQLNPEERAGILTQPSWLVAHSGNFDNDPVRRGKWILDRLLAGTVPDIPISVCASVPEDNSKTLRERFDGIKNDSYCWKCHYQMNPLGMPFEQYDHYGRYRLNELKKPVNTTGLVVDIGDKEVDGPVNSPIELIHRLAKAKRTQEVFIRYAFRYFLGRNETPRDAKTLQEANKAYNESSGSFKALVASILSSDSFLYRTMEL